MMIKDQQQTWNPMTYEEENSFPIDQKNRFIELLISRSPYVCVYQRHCPLCLSIVTHKYVKKKKNIKKNL